MTNTKYAKIIAGTIKERSRSYEGAVWRVLNRLGVPHDRANGARLISSLERSVQAKDDSSVEHVARDLAIAFALRHLVNVCHIELV